MKNTFKYIAALVALLSGFAVYAQNLETDTYEETNGVAYAKRAILNNDGTYTIKLETFVTGEVTETKQSFPADVVLVLDVSGSMDDTIINYEYSQATVSSITGSGLYYGAESTGYYYKYNDAYYEVFRGIARGWGWGSSNYYYLAFSAHGTTLYINTNGQVVADRPSNVTDEDTNLLASNVQLYSRQATGSTTKLAALQMSVKAFIDQIAHNDLYEDDTFDKPRKDPLGNRIAIVKFGLGTYNGSTTFNENTHLTPGNHFCSVTTNRWEEITGYTNYTSTYNNNYNVTEVIAGFTPTADASDVSSLKTTVEGLHAAGATAADMGMKLAYELVNRIGDDGEDRSDSRKTVVFFTDGEPNHQTDYDTSVANGAITNANNIKNISYTVPDPEHEGQTMTIHPTVFSVGLFSDEVDSRVDGFMTSIASDSDKYMDASGGSAEDLKNIFEAIAHASGGSGNTDVSGGSTLTVDVVSSSFSVPTGFESASDVVSVTVAPCVGKTTIGGKEYLTFGEEKAPAAYGLDDITPAIDEEKNTVSTSGFDYSANWCGPDPTSTSQIQPGYHGFKQIITFIITVNEDAVGGPAVETNDSDSGIYLPGETKPLITFNRPTVKLPVQIWIQKQGLRPGDSAVFTLAMCKFTDWDPEEEDINKQKWSSFTKVVISYEDMDENGVVKIVGLDPDFFYRLKEDAWAFGYTYQDGGIQYTVGDNVANPFIFKNEPKDLKFDEASARNIFNEKTAE